MKTSQLFYCAALCLCACGAPEPDAAVEPEDDVTKDADLVALEADSCVQGTVNGSRTVRAIVRQEFGRYGEQALRVARCESGTSGTRARNGQYLGLFQMGAYARSAYGHSSCAQGQARAAYRYFAASGKGWSPWSCKP